jgi:hypothetical protein
MNVKLARIIGVIAIVGGVLCAIIGVAAYTFTSIELKNQHITVASVTPEDPGALAGDDVNGPFSALAEVNAIAHHTAASTGGKTYGELGSVATSDGATYNREVAVGASTDGQAHAKGDPLSADDAKTYASRNLAMNSSFLRASLYTSVLAFGVSALVAGIGVALILLGLAIVVISSRLVKAEE